jgi:hypothetical protein
VWLLAIVIVACGQILITIARIEPDAATVMRIRPPAFKNEAHCGLKKYRTQSRAKRGELPNMRFKRKENWRKG